MSGRLFQDPYTQISHFTLALRKAGFTRMPTLGRSRSKNHLTHYRRYHPEFGNNTYIEVVFQRYGEYERSLNFCYHGRESPIHAFFFTPNQLRKEIDVAYETLKKRNWHNSRSGV
jgi:hypothetical protein